MASDLFQFAMVPTENAIRSLLLSITSPYKTQCLRRSRSILGSALFKRLSCDCGVQYGTVSDLSQLTDTIPLMASDLFQFAMVPTENAIQSPLLSIACPYIAQCLRR